MKTTATPLLAALFLSSIAAFAVQACSADTRRRAFGEGGGGSGGSIASSSSTSSSSGDGGTLVFTDGGLPEGGDCGPACNVDFTQVLSCQGDVVQTCTGDQACDSTKGVCTNACAAAVNNKQSVGCEYYATFMDQFNEQACFAVFVANTWSTPVHVTVEYAGMNLPLASFARIPSGSGPNLQYQPFDPAVGVPPGEVAVLFLSGPQGGQSPQCPITSAVPAGVLKQNQTFIGSSFHITTDVPVVAYEINPYGGGSAAVTAASLLLPTSAWDTNYVAVNAAPYTIGSPSMNIVAMADNTLVTMVPAKAVQGGGGVPSGPAGQPMTFTLNRGQQAQISQHDELTGSVIQSDKPIGFMAGNNCMQMPAGTAYCDHGEQMIPPVRALGSEYVGVQYRPRMGEPGIWRVVGAIDGTVLTWSSNVGGPPSLAAGQSVEFITGEPFVVKSQDKDHPFMLFAYMSGSSWKPGMDGYGDPEFVISVPPEQYMTSYVFFADPTYPETNLVVVRAKGAKGFSDVTLDCAGTLAGWQPVGDYEWTRVDLITGNFQSVGGCSTGRREMKSDSPFGLWVWGWGTPLTGGTFTQNVSYGYPGGMNVRAINTVVIPPIPN